MWFLEDINFDRVPLYHYYIPFPIIDLWFELFNKLSTNLCSDNNATEDNENVLAAVPHISIWLWIDSIPQIYIIDSCQKRSKYHTIVDGILIDWTWLRYWEDWCCQPAAHQFIVKHGVDQGTSRLLSALTAINSYKHPQLNLVTTCPFS